MQKNKIYMFLKFISYAIIGNIIVGISIYYFFASSCFQESICVTFVDENNKPLTSSEILIQRVYTTKFSSFVTNAPRFLPKPIDENGTICIKGDKGMFKDRFLVILNKAKKIDENIFISNAEELSVKAFNNICEMPQVIKVNISK